MTRYHRIIRATSAFSDTDVYDLSVECPEPAGEEDLDLELHIMVVDRASQVAAIVVVLGVVVGFLPDVLVAEGGAVLAFWDEGDFDAVGVVERWALVWRHAQYRRRLAGGNEAGMLCALREPSVTGGMLRVDEARLIRVLWLVARSLA